MKKFYLMLSLCLSAYSFAQENDLKTSTDLSQRKHEVKIDALKMIALATFEGTYEYIQSEDITFGASLAANFQDQEESEFDEKFSVTPFVRFYFQNKQKFEGQGFFVEGFAKYVNGVSYYYEGNSGSYYDYSNQEWVYYSYPSETQKYDSGSLEVALGGKWVNKSGIVFEMFGGIGRKLIGSKEATEFTPRVALNLGYRF